MVRGEDAVFDHPRVQRLGEPRFEGSFKHSLPPTAIERGRAPGPLRIKERSILDGAVILEFAPVEIDELEAVVNSDPRIVAVAGLSYWVTLPNKPVQEKTKKWAALDEVGWIYRVAHPGIRLGNQPGTAIESPTTRLGVTLGSNEAIGCFVDPDYVQDEEEVRLDKLARWKKPTGRQTEITLNGRPYTPPPYELLGIYR